MGTVGWVSMRKPLRESVSFPEGQNTGGSGSDIGTTDGPALTGYGVPVSQSSEDVPMTGFRLAITAQCLVLQLRYPSQQVIPALYPVPVQQYAVPAVSMCTNDKRIPPRGTPAYVYFWLLSPDVDYSGHLQCPFP